MHSSKMSKFLPVERASSSKDDPFYQKPTEDSATNLVTCIHRAKLAGSLRDVSVTWSNNPAGHSLYIAVGNNPIEKNHSSCKISVRNWNFWGKKGLKSFTVDEKRVDVFWDFRTAKFTNSPEPACDYYVAMVSEEEVVLLLGDQKKEAYRRTKSRPSLLDAELVHKKESVYAKKCFCTKTIIGQRKKEHNIIIESALSGPNDPEMLISVDGTLSIRVFNLHWRFRGNETIVVDEVPVQIFWDVHDWLYSNNNSPNSGVGTFVFVQGTVEEGDQCVCENQRCDVDGCGLEIMSAAEFCHFVYAWKID